MLVSFNASESVHMNSENALEIDHYGGISMIKLFAIHFKNFSTLGREILLEAFG